MFLQIPSARSAPLHVGLRQRGSTSFFDLYAALKGRSFTRNRFILCGPKGLLFHQELQHKERSPPNRDLAHYSSIFFALEREEVVEERPFRAV